MNINILLADYHNPKHANDILKLMSAYALDPMGGGEPLSQEVKDKLVAGLANFPGAFSVLAYEQDNTHSGAIGLINCMPGYSTFKAKSLVNIHDVIVLDGYRGQGISTLMLKKVEQIAIERNCCKLTLEVLSNNQAAQKSYQKFGFSAYQLDPDAGQALFWQKQLNS